ALNYTPSIVTTSSRACANQSCSAMSQTGRFIIPDDPDAGIHPAVAPAPDDVIVVKKRISACRALDRAPGRRHGLPDDRDQGLLPRSRRRGAPGAHGEGLSAAHHGADIRRDRPSASPTELMRATSAAVANSSSARDTTAR